VEIKKCIKSSFSVIGKLGSTEDGNGFIQKLWEDANMHFSEIASLAKKDSSGNFIGFWGAMSDFSLAFNPWEDLSNGLYLAGVEVNDDAIPPYGWTKWTVPSYEFLCFKQDEEYTFEKVRNYLQENSISLAGAIHDFNDPKENGQGYTYVPIKKM
jgi:predicted transcriptional regulator YdeE